MNEDVIAGLKKLREPFPEHHISLKPAPTKNQTESLKSNINLGINCKECGTWHHKDTKHLLYVGHAALTDRLLDVDPFWTWEPLSYTDEGLPRFDNTGGLWIKLTVLGVTRIGYGHAMQSGFKEIGSREKEVIGDCLRNAGMRFGAALELWHKGDLHIDDEPDEKKQQEPPKTNIFADTLSKVYASQSSDFSWIESKLFTKEQVAEIRKACAKRREELNATKADYLTLIKKAITVEEAQAVYNAIPDEQKAEFNDALDLRLDELRG